MSVQELGLREFRVLTHFGEGQPLAFFSGYYVEMTGH